MGCCEASGLLRCLRGGGLRCIDAEEAPGGRAAGLDGIGDLLRQALDDLGGQRFGATTKIGEGLSALGAGGGGMLGDGLGSRNLTADDGVGDDKVDADAGVGDVLDLIGDSSRGGSPVKGWCTLLRADMRTIVSTGGECNLGSAFSLSKVCSAR